MAGDPRQVALECLMACEKQGAWSDGYLKKALSQAGLDGRDSGLCTRLAYGVLQNLAFLDWNLERHSTKKVSQMDPKVRNSLRLGLYQLLFMDRVPGHAAVNESVELVKGKGRNPKAAGFVNGVLRSLQREKMNGMPQPKALEIRYSHPEWLVKEFNHTLSNGELEALLAADNAQPPVMAQVNTLKTTARELSDELTEAGVGVQAHPWLPNCLELTDTGALEAIPAFREGRFYIQDAAAKLAVLAADPRPGMAVLDACAAPGGKSFAAAIQMEGKGNILSCDIHPHKQKLIENGANRLGFECVSTAVMDAKAFAPELEGKFGLVIADVPCSGLGIIRKKPDIRYKDPAPLEGLPKVQSAILENVARYVKPGGALLYATCTLLERENGDVVSAFLERHGEFALEPFALPAPVDGGTGMVTLWPHRHGTDGFFFAKLRRK